MRQKRTISIPTKQLCRSHKTLGIIGDDRKDNRYSDVVPKIRKTSKNELEGIGSIFHLLTKLYWFLCFLCFISFLLSFVLFGGMLSRTLYSVSKGAMRVAPLVSQIPAMNYTVDMRVREEMKMVFNGFYRILLYSRATSCLKSIVITLPRI